jgi:ribosomal protein S18
VQAKEQKRPATKGNFKDCWNHLGMDEFIGDKAKKMKAQIEKLCVENKDKFIDYIESKKTLPDFFISEMQKIGACGFTCKGYGSPELTMLESGAMLYELGRADIGLALFMFL